MVNPKSLDAPVLVRLTYASRAKPDLSGSDLKQILNQARKNNAQNGVTGMLCFNKQYFLQTIEGARAEISTLLNKLAADNRHYDVQIIESIEVDHREWSQWSMNYATPSSENRDRYLKYSSTQSFNPYLLSARSAYDLLKELSQELN